MGWSLTGVSGPTAFTPEGNCSGTSAGHGGLGQAAHPSTAPACPQGQRQKLRFPLSFLHPQVWGFMGLCHYGKSQPRNLGNPCGAQKRSRAKNHNAWKTGFWASYESGSSGQVLSGLAACFESNAVNFGRTIWAIKSCWKCYWAVALSARGHNSASMNLRIQDVHFHFKKGKHFVDFSLGAARQNPLAAAAIETEGKALPGSRSCETVASGPFSVKKMRMA